MDGFSGLEVSRDEKLLAIFFLQLSLILDQEFGSKLCKVMN